MFSALVSDGRTLIRIRPKKKKEPGASFKLKVYYCVNNSSSYRWEGYERNQRDSSSSRPIGQARINVQLLCHGSGSIHLYGSSLERGPGSSIEAIWVLSHFINYSCYTNWIKTSWTYRNKIESSFFSISARNYDEDIHILRKNSFDPDSDWGRLLDPDPWISNWSSGPQGRKGAEGVFRRRKCNQNLPENHFSPSTHLHIPRTKTGSRQYCNANPYDDGKHKCKQRASCKSKKWGITSQ